MFECFVETKYLNGLRLDCFSQLLTDNAQGYKFYWLEAIVELSIDSDGDIPFDEIFNQMIFNAWYSKTYYHLRLGPVVKENNKYNSVQAISEQNNEDPELDEGNYLEQAITKLNKYEPKLLKGNIKADIIKAAINKHSNDLLSFKMDLCNYVPHRLLTPFFIDNDLKEGLNYIKKDSRRKFYKYLSELDPKYNPLYIIVDGRGIDKKIRLNKFWKSFLVDNYVIIKDWIQFNKVQYLQDHNPGVPDISRKITLETQDKRKLENVRTLWKMYSKITGKPLIDIYSGKPIQDKKLSIDHFIPRSYISNDELWDLVPMDKSLNSSKNNSLPNWEIYYKRFSEMQFMLYETIFIKDKEINSDELIQQFYKCKKYNLNSKAAEELFVKGHNETEFKHKLFEVVYPLYHSADLMKYEKWMTDKDSKYITTKNYYDSHSEEYCNSSFFVDMSSLYNEFEGLIPAKGSILDVGCGCGRDSLHFSQKGFKVTAIDYSEKMCSITKEKTGVDAEIIDMRDINYQNEFDGVWACASLLHLTKDDAVLALQKLVASLKYGGILYASWKKGEGERDDEYERYYSDLGEAEIERIIEQTNTQMLKCWISSDALSRQNQSWLNVLLKKM